MRDSADAFLIFILGMLCGVVLLAAIEVVCGKTYKQGQIDAINGEVKYHLVEQDDKSVEWRRNSE